LAAVLGGALTSFTLIGLVIWVAGRSRSTDAAPVSEVDARTEPEPSEENPTERPSAAPPASLEEIAHDINDLMTVVVAQAELMRERHTGWQTAEFEPILDAASRLSGLARKLVAFAERQRGESPPSERRVLVGPGVVRAPRESLPPPDAIPSIVDAVDAVRDSVSAVWESPAMSERRRAGGAGTVLLVEDELVLLKATRRMLEQRGFQVLAAASGSEALDLARAAQGIDALVTDLSLPGMDGMELARRLRREHPRLPVLFTSGYDVPATGLALGSGGRAAFLPKPFTARELADRLAELFGPAERGPLAQPG